MQPKTARHAWRSLGWSRSHGDSSAPCVASQVSGNLAVHDPCRFRSAEKCQVFLRFENPRSACCIEIHKRLHMFETGLVFCHKATRYVWFHGISLLPGVDEVKLCLHIGVGCGDISILQASFLAAIFMIFSWVTFFSAAVNQKLLTICWTLCCFF